MKLLGTSLVQSHVFKNEKSPYQFLDMKGKSEKETIFPDEIVNWWEAMK